MTSREKNLYFQVLFATLVWGAAYPFTKFAVTEISPLTLVFLRAFPSAVLLLYVSRRLISFSDFNISFLFKLFIMSVLGVSLQQYTQASALKYTSASNAGWLIALTPIIVVFLRYMAGEKISFYKSLGFFFGFSGTLAIIFSKTGFSGFSLYSGKGDLIFLTSCFAWAYYVILTKKWFEKDSQVKITALTMSVAAFTVLPFFVGFKGFEEIHNLSPKGWLCVGYLTFLSSFLAYLFWNNSVEGLGPVKSSYFIYDEPFATVVSAYLFLGEKAPPSVFAGGAAILLGVYFVNSSKPLFFLKTCKADGKN